VDNGSGIKILGRGNHRHTSQKLAAALVIPATAATRGIARSAIRLAIFQESYNLVHVIQFTHNRLVIAAVYGLVGFALGSWTGRRGLWLGTASGFVFVSYLINSMAPSVAFLETLDKATFFHYYQNDPFAWKNFLLLAGIALALVAISIFGLNIRYLKSN
jgi:hypothetical protein